MTLTQRTLKRSLDIVVAGFGLVFFGWLVVLAWVWTTVETGRNGLFFQERIGQHGVPFKMIKIRTMADVQGLDTTVTTVSDVRITRTGKLLRRFKIDELPQLWNVLRGEMSLVGPRPDVAGWADRLLGHDSLVLSVRPGITGPATLAFRNEERLLAAQPDPERYNREVLYPAKVSMNIAYIESYSFWNDVRLIARTPFEIVDAGRRSGSAAE